jgi:hypothetical protein
MGKRALKKRIQSLTSRLEEHKLKIDLERLKSIPDSSLIRHWEKEISAFQKSIERAIKRLGHE